VTHPPDRLTRRELAVLRLAADGNSNAMIGRALAIRETTVKSHVSAALAKLCANDRTHAVVLALRHGLIPLSAAPAQMPAQLPDGAPTTPR
jgi:DNA-binding NarL/FixJ family response regulator